MPPFKYTFGMSRTKISPELAKKVYEFCNKTGVSFLEEEYVKDSSGEGYKRYFYIFNMCYPDNFEYIKSFYERPEKAEIILPE